MSQKSTAEIYTRLADKYHSNTEIHLEAAWDKIFDRFDFAGKRTFVDIGCGPGGTISLLSQHLKDEKIKFFGVDICDKILEQAKAEVASAVTANSHVIEFISGDCLKFLDSNREEFDVVIASMLLAYVKPEELFPRIPRFLKNNGTFIIISTSSGLLKELETLFWNFALTHPWFFRWHTVLTEKTSYVKPLDRLIGMLAGFSKITSFPVNIKIQFPDPAACLDWTEHSGLAAPFFDLIKAGKREQVMDGLVKFAERRGAECFHQPIKHGKPFLFVWPLDCVIAEK
jgi:ubiquinone/menaquinone biosynthesis C-methylase UbiE